MTSMQLEHILPSAQFKAIAFGLLKNDLIEQELASIGFGSLQLKVCKKVLPNKFARLDTLYVNGKPAGSVVSVKLSHAVLHMVGMFIHPSYRRSQLSHTLISEGGDERDLSACPSPSKFLMEALIRDLQLANTQMTLEVMNNNRGAIELYETSFNMDGINCGFKLMPRHEIVPYAKCRSKKIGKWHELQEGRSDCVGVQWSDTPEYNNSSRWSINRIYLLTFNNEPIKLDEGIAKKMQLKCLAFYSIIRFGSLAWLTELTISKILSKFRSPSK